METQALTDGQKLQFINAYPSVRRRWRSLTSEMKHQTLDRMEGRPTEKELQTLIAQVRKQATRLKSPEKSVN